jgi:hypothetical protein
MEVSSVVSTASSAPLRRHEHLTMAALPRWWAVGTLGSATHRARRREAGGGMLMLVLSVDGVVSTTPAVSTSWSITAVFCSFTNGVTLLLKHDC